MIRLRYLCCGALLVTAGCAPKAGLAPGPLDNAHIDAAHRRWPDVSAVTLERGRQAFVSSCNRCHQYPDRAAYDEAHWPAIMRRMAGKARLSADEEASILRFILAERQNVSAAAARQSELTP